MTLVPNQGAQTTYGIPKEHRPNCEGALFVKHSGRIIVLIVLNETQKIP